MIVLWCNFADVFGLDPTIVHPYDEHSYIYYYGKTEKRSVTLSRIIGFLSLQLYILGQSVRSLLVAQPPPTLRSFLLHAFFKSRHLIFW